MNKYNMIINLKIGRWNEVKEWSSQYWTRGRTSRKESTCLQVARDSGDLSGPPAEELYRGTARQADTDTGAKVRA